MHVITKILVVIAAVLSILLAALTIAYSTNAQRIVAGYTAAQLDAETARAELAGERARHSSELAALSQQIDDLAAERTAARTELERAKLDNSNLLADAKSAEAAGLTVQARIDQLAAMSQMQASLIESMYTEVGTLRSSELRYAQREIEFTDRFNDLTAQLEVAREANRALQEQLASIQTDRGVRPPGAQAAARPFNAPIQARVTNVRRDTSGKALAEIDGGSSDQLSNGMELNVVRDGAFVGTVRLSRVDINESIGVFNPLGLGTEVRPGDIVVSSIR